MARARTAQRINDFLGSAQVFTSTVSAVVEKRLLREVAGNRLTFSQFKLLKLVALTEAHTIGDVAVFLGVSNAAASKAVDRMVRRQFLRRTEGEADRRAVQLSLTEPSRRLLAAYDAAKNRELAKIFSRFSLAELRRTAELLDRLSAGIVNRHSRPEDVCLQCGIYFRQDCLIRRLTGRRCFYHLHKSRPNQEPLRPAKVAPSRRAKPGAPGEKRF